ncbi:MAG: tetratricopeptide repeat protein [Candidatus Obscuribacterales bacterium]|nr:tetratricopeptide repeat protein [Candidatus Obscuribacterales bacterium]
MSKQIEEGVGQYGRGEFAQAVATLQTAADDLKGKENLRADHANALDWLGRALIWLAEYELAESNLSESRAIKEALYGQGSKDVALSDLYLSDLAIAREQFQPGFKLATDAMAVIQEKAPANDLAIAEACSRVGVAGSYLRKIDESENLLNKALGIRKGKFEEDHPLVGQTLDDLSVCHAACGNFTMAGALGRKALAIREKALGKDHPEVGVSLYHLASQYVRSSMFEKAEPVARRGLEILSKHLPKDHALTIRMQERLATICLADGRNDEAEELQKKALASAEKLWGKDSPSVVSNLIGLGSTYLNKTDFKNAEEYFKRSLNIMEKAPQIDTGQEYNLLQNLSCCYIFQLKVGDALQLVPSSFRAKHTSNFHSSLDLIRMCVDFAMKQIDNFKKDRGEYN